MDNDLIREKIRQLNHGECFMIPESDYGLAEVWRIWDTYLLFGIPTYGGTPYFEKAYSLNMGDPVERIIDTINKWT